MSRLGAIRTTWAGRRRDAKAAEGSEPFHVTLDYPVTPVARHGWGRPPHPQLAALLDAGRDRCRETLESFLEYGDGLAAIPVEWVSDTDPFWNNHWFQGLDIVALYSFVARRAAGTCLEIGSGYSTRVARRAIRDHGLATRLVSVDPEPRASVRAIVDEHVASALEDVELTIFDALQPGDIVLFDGSHRVFTNSDVTVLFTEVLPRLAPGVLVQVHDIFVPWDYRPDWSDRWYSEQYLLAGWLLAGSRLDVVMPNFYVSLQDDLHDILSPIWARLEPPSVNRECPSAFWFETRE